MRITLAPAEFAEARSLSCRDRLCTARPPWRRCVHKLGSDPGPSRSPPSHDEFLTVDDVASLLKVDQQTVRNWIDRGELPGVRVGSRHVRVRQSDLEAFIDAGSTVAPITEPSTAPLDEGSMTAWATRGARMAEATATLQDGDRVQLVAVLESLSQAARELAERLRGAPDA
jgi:excisionase family DNA binding protein